MCKSVNVNSVVGNSNSKVMEDKDMLNVVEKLVNWEVSEGFVRGLDRKHLAEKVCSYEDKVRVIDAHHDGKMSYILELIEKFKAEYKSIKTVYCEPDFMISNSLPRFNTNSLKAWMRKNDTKNITYNKGTFHFYDRYFNVVDYSGLYCDGLHRDFLTPSVIVDYTFESLLSELYKKETHFYLHHNPDVLYVESVCKKLEKYGYSSNMRLSLSFSGDYLEYRYTSSKGYIIEKSIISNGHTFTKTPLSIEEVKQLNKALAPVEEKYQAAVRAKEELKSALKQAGVDFLNAVGIK